MTEGQRQLLATLRGKRDELVQRSTDIAYATNDVDLPRADVEQMLRACIALLEEGLVGESRAVRDGFLAALDDVARTTTWELTMRTGLPCWGIIVGRLAVDVGEAHRDEAIAYLSRFMGDWWADVSKVMLPVFMAEGKL